MMYEIAEWSPSSSAAAGPVIYVANAGTPSTVTAINSATDAIEKVIPIRSGTALSVGVAPNGNTAYAVVVGSDEAGSPGSLLPISTTTNIASKAIAVGVDPRAVAFNPNGRFAYVVNGFDAATTAPSTPGTITPINLAEGVAGQPIKVGTNPSAIAITPDGRAAYVANSNATNGNPTTVTAINLATNTPEKTIHIAARSIAVTQNGETAYALGENTVTPIATATDRPGKSIRLGGDPEAIALAPDGQIAWVLSTPDRHLEPRSNKVTLTAINTATNAIGKVITLAGMPDVGQFFISITPNGAHIFVLGQGSGKTASIVVAIAASTGVARSPIKAGTDAAAVAANPDGNLVYVLTPGTDYLGPTIASQPKTTPGTVIPISTATNKAGKPITVGLLASAIAVMP